jgi:3-dehydrotetronate 4-kinase
MKLGCIADDYTGATDLAGLLARSGARVQLHFGLPPDDQSSTADIEIIALKCRSLPVDEAVRDCETAGHWLLARGAITLYWKYCSTFDSTAQGNIGPVAEALMQLTGQSQALYCPAFPENGRAVFMGHLFVGSQLLSESSLKDHPLNPMTDANLRRVLAPQVTHEVGLWSRIAQRAGEPIPEATHVIADAVEFSDLERLIAETPDSVLLTGGSALAMPLPAKLGITQNQPPSWPKVTNSSLILSGSCSEMTQQQVAIWKATHPAFQINPEDPEGADRALAWWRHQAPEQPCLIYATDTPERVKASQAALGIHEAGQRIETAMARIATEAYASGVRRFVIAGGETSGAVTQALGIAQVLVGPEICPGVPWVFANQSSDPLALALKSGNFGGPDFFIDALNDLKGL